MSYGNIMSHVDAPSNYKKHAALKIQKFVIFSLIQNKAAYPEHFTETWLDGVSGLMFAQMVPAGYLVSNIVGHQGSGRWISSHLERKCPHRRYPLQTF